MPPPRLHHLHLGRTTYTHASTIQSHLVSAFLVSKAHPSTTPPPPPTIITSEFNPVYTLGRRDRGGTVSDSELSHLRVDGRAEVHEALRGGQTTFHGPGQLTAYLILDLRAYNGLTPRCYVRVLEDTLIRLLGQYDIAAFTTQDTGVWTKAQPEAEARKIAAVGVHMRRNITSHGVGLNVSTDLWWFERIVACGLEGKGTTSMLAEGVEGVSVEEAGRKWVRIVAERLGCEEVVPVGEERVLALHTHV